MGSLPLPTARTFAFWVAGAALALLGVILGNQDTIWPALFIGLLPVAALVAAVVWRPRFAVSRTVTPGIVAAGEQARVDLVTTARRPSRAGTVVGEDAPGAALGPAHVVRLGAATRGQQSHATYGLSPARRGRYTLDGFRYRFLDLFGFWVTTARVSEPTHVTVTPQVLPLVGTSGRVYGATGETPIPQTAIVGPDDVMVREYQPRDDVRRIHWPSTARSGQLMVRREEAAWDPTAWVVLDSRAAVAGEGRRAFEQLVVAAASIGVRLLGDGFTTTLVDAEGTSHEVSADAEGAASAWLDPLVDVDVTGEADLHEATALMARAGSEHLVVALLGDLDVTTANLLASATTSRQTRLAFVAGEASDPAGRDVLVDRGWGVHDLGPGADLGAVWAAAGAEGVR